MKLGLTFRANVDGLASSVGRPQKRDYDEFCARYMRD